MSEEFENQQEYNKDCNCTEENKDHCTCNDDCHCEEENIEYDCYCSKVEKLYIISAIANIITAIVVTALAGTIFFNMFQIHKAANPKVNKQAEQAKPVENGSIFSKKSISLDDAMKNSKTAIVLFYADWCPHCRNFAPTFKELEKDRILKKKYNFVRINSEDPAAESIMREYEIKGFPSLFMVNPRTKEKQQVENYIMFGDNAKETLVSIFEEFDNK